MAAIHMNSDQRLLLSPEVGHDAAATTIWEWRRPELKEEHGEDDEEYGDYTDFYLIGSQLGEGGFGAVFAGFRIADGVQVALKLVDKDKEDGLLLPGQTVETPTEVGLTALVNRNGGHRNILRLHEWYDEPDEYIMVLERPDNCMDLTTFVASQNGRLNEQMAMALTEQLVQALLHCQECGVFHRDVKPANILIESDTMRIILIDFGCGDLWKDTPYTSYSGTVEYAPPEFFGVGTYHAGPATVWSLGVTLYELVCGCQPLRYCDEQGVVKLHFPAELSLEIIDFISCCLSLLPEDRATLEELNVHRWFRPICAVPEPKEENGEDDEEYGDYTDLYLIGSQLGKGGFGSVFAGFRIADGVQVALKFVEKQEEDELLLPGQTVGTPTEVGLMTLVNRNGGHRNILRLHEWYDEPDEYVMVLERPDNCMDLTKFVASQNGRLNEQLAMALTEQLVQALLHCQECGVFHRDVKPANILIESDTMRIILIDFGCGDLWKDTLYTSYSGTVEYAPPELFDGGTYHAGPATVWSLGVTLCELFGSSPLCDNYDMLDCMNTLPTGLSPEILHFVHWCLAPSEEDRFTLEELLDHQWFYSFIPTQEERESEETEENLSCSSISSTVSDWETADVGGWISEGEDLASAAPLTPSSRNSSKSDEEHPGLHMTNFDASITAIPAAREMERHAEERWIYPEVLESADSLLAPEEREMEDGEESPRIQLRPAWLASRGDR